MVSRKKEEGSKKQEGPVPNKGRIRAVEAAPLSDDHHVSMHLKPCDINLVRRYASFLRSTTSGSVPIRISMRVWILIHASICMHPYACTYACILCNLLWYLPRGFKLKAHAVCTLAPKRYGARILYAAVPHCRNGQAHRPQGARR